MMTTSLRRVLFRCAPGRRSVIGLGCAVMVYVIALTLLLPVMGKIALNGTASIDAHILWQREDGPIARGDYVMAPVRHPMIPSDYSHLTKHALCLEGDMLTARDGAFFCNGELIHRVKAQTRSGAPLEPFHWTKGKVPAGKVFIGSRHPDGFDSRYLGFFDIDDLTRLEKIL